MNITHAMATFSEGKVYYMEPSTSKSAELLLNDISLADDKRLQLSLSAVFFFGVQSMSRCMRYSLTL